jgi:uncharacterized protein (TIGR02996 family)
MSSATRAQVLAFLADIKEHPDEEGLRLILADWLEEFGDALDQARAELIRCQIDHARLPAEEPQKYLAGRRARWLQQKHGPAWLGPLEQWLSGWTFQRGLLSVSVPVAALRGQAMALLAASETWAWVDEVFLLGASDTDIARLRGCVLLDALLSLGLRRGTVGPAGVRALGELPLARRLHGLDLSHCPIGDEGAEELTAPGFATLRRLELPACSLSPLGGSFLAGAHAPANPPFPDLERLILWGNDLGNDGIRRLTRTRWPRLRVLDLRGNHIGDAGGHALAGWRGLAGVRALNLADNQLGPAVARALAESPYVDGIESLELWGNPIGPDGAERLRGRFGTRVHVSPARF